MTSHRDDSREGLLDGEVRRLVLAGQLREAADLLISRLSPEIRPFLYRLLGDVVLAEEAHSATCERLWRGLGGFRWSCSLRSWSYIVARREASRCRDHFLKAAAAQTTLSAAENLPARTSSTGRLSTTKANVLDEVRSTLSDEDRDLLVLRIERGLPWKEIALAFLAEDSTDPEVIAREAARLRQRFRSIREDVTSAVSRAKGPLPESGKS